jgi:ERCC4-type nuclease
MMGEDQGRHTLTIWATKPEGRPAAMLSAMGIAVLAAGQQESSMDRYVLSQRVAVDRRTGSSFLQGIRDKTLFTYATDLRECFQVPLLIVEGEVDYEHTGFSVQAVRGALSSMVLLYGVTVVSTPSMEETVGLIATMARQEQVGIPEISLTPKRKAIGLADMQRRVVEMLPGCGMVAARELLQQFGSIRRIVSASEAELCSVGGIGARRAAGILEVVNAEYASVDTERQLEDAIEAAPELLSGRSATLVARQHHLVTPQGERLVIDLVFLDAEQHELVLAELKLGKLERAHEEQLRRYLDHAHQSPLLRSFLDRGMTARGVLATVDNSEFQPRHRDITAQVVDREQAARILMRLRDQRFQGEGIAEG